LNLIIQKKPHLLFSAKDAEEDGGPQPPLFVWLYPKLLGLLSHITLQPLHQHAQDLLGLSLEVLVRVPSFWRNAASVAALYRSSIEGKWNHGHSVHLAEYYLVIVVELETVSDPSLVRAQAFQITLPSPSGIGEFWPESQQLVALPHEFQRTISSQIGAVYIGFKLLLSFVHGARQQQGYGQGSTTFEHHQPWILDTCLKLWRHFQRWTVGSDKPPFREETVSSYLQLLGAVAVPSGTSENCPSVSSKAAQTLIRGLSNLLEKPIFSTPNQIQLASLLIRLRRTLSSPSKSTSTPGRRRFKPTSVIADDLGTRISELCHDAEKFSGLQKDLQVRVARILYYYHDN
jgi:serine/threonine-protein kinase ATR